VPMVHGKYRKRCISSKKDVFLEERKTYATLVIFSERVSKSTPVFKERHFSFEKDVFFLSKP